MLSSVVLDLRLIGFEAAQSSSRRRRLGDPVAAANSFELALTDDLHRHPDLPVVGSLCRAAHTGSGTERPCRYLKQVNIRDTPISHSSPTPAHPT